MRRLPKIHRYFFLIFVSSLICAPLSAQAFTLLTPDSESIIYSRSPSTHIVVKASSGDDPKALALNSSKGVIPPSTISKGDQGYFIHYRVPLNPGKNRFSFSSSLEDVIIEYRPLRVLLDPDFDKEKVFLYHRDTTTHEQCLDCHTEAAMPESSFIRRYPCPDKSPACYSCHQKILKNVVWRHSPTAGLLCEICHRKSKKSGRISVVTGQDADLCYKCHRVKGQAWGEQARVHQPVGLGVCTICHDPHGDANRYQLWADGQGKICVTCHGDKKELLQGGEVDGEFVHDIIRGGGCIICHDAHASSNPYMLQRPVNELCAGCHNDLVGIKKGHPVGGHPLQGPRNPLHPDKEFNCASCHDPHSSRYQYLLVGSLIGGHICKKCHN